jgi:sigma-B regulation protein RsbU (phosphoserine phosphatase)
MPQKSARLQFALLALVVAGLLIFYGMGAAAVLQGMLHGTTTVASPFETNSPPNQLDTLTPAAWAAGLHPGDSVLSLNGLPFRSQFQLLSLLRAAHPGDTLQLTFRPPHSSSIRSASIRLAPIQTGPVSLLYRFTVDIFLHLVFPLGCILLGAWVVTAKPRDPNAWFLLGIFCFFPTVFLPAVFWPGTLAYIAAAVGTVANILGALCILLFGIYFPQRSLFDIRFPWAKWIPAILLGTSAALAETYLHGFLYSFASIAWMSGPHPYAFAIVPRVINLTSMLCFTAFFILLARKLSNTQEADAKRRLRILYWGATIGCLPAFAATIIQIFRNVPFDQTLPQWLLLIVFSIFTLFPLTLAYVVVVQRAMDLRILVRQGTRYALARRSLMVIRIALAIGISWSLTLLFQHAEQLRVQHARGIPYLHAQHLHNADLMRVAIFTALFMLFRFGLSARLQLRIDQQFFREAYSAEQVLSELADQVRSFTEVDPLLHFITTRIGHTLHVPRIAVLLRSGDTFRLSTATGLNEPADPLPGFTLPAASTTIATLVRTKSPANVYPDDPSSWLVEATPSERAALASLHAELLVPLPGRGRLAGVIVLGPKQSEEAYTRSDRQLLQSVASQAGLAIENAELLQTLSAEVSERERILREIEIAREVQERLFPQSYPQLPGISLAGFCRPAQAVGGDYFDFFVIDPGPANTVETETNTATNKNAASAHSDAFPAAAWQRESVDAITDPTTGTTSVTDTEGGPVGSAGDMSASVVTAVTESTLVTRLPRLALALGDISGKGISAALLMAGLRASLRSLALTRSDSPTALADLVGNLNRLVFDSSSPSRYATFFYAEYDPCTCTLAYVNAGHNAPCVLRSGHAIRLQTTGTVIGLLPEAQYTQAAVQLQPGDVLIAFTDGISEAMTHASEEWGEERLIPCAAAALAASPGASAQAILNCILTAADAFTAGAPQHDDMTLLVCALST